MSSRCSFAFAPHRSVLTLAVLVCVLSPQYGLAQQETRSVGIPRFALPSSGLEWRQPVHPLKFFDQTGRRAAVFGKQTGQFEAWIYPIKVLHGFRLEFRQEGMPEAVRGENILEEIIVRPESTTLVYVHPRFTVRQIIWTPLLEPAIVQFFDVDTNKPLAITAKFIPDFKPMWPASLGGQYSYWLSEEKAFALTDATSKPTALVGSPAVGAFTEHMDHALVGGEMLLQLRVEPQQARSMLIPLVMSLSMNSAKAAREKFREVVAGARDLFEKRVAYHRDFLARTLRIETPDPELNRAFEWAKVAIDAGWVCTPTKFSEGCGLVAGYGPSGDSERPGFAWWFGGDALMASWAMLDYGDHAGALQVLRFLKARQRADGKMMHEMTQSVDLVDWFGKYGFAYYHADTTPMYIYSVGEYWRRTGDRKFLEEFWPSVKKAYEYCLSTVDPADGLMDNTKAGLAAVEVGPLRGKVVKDIYLQGFWLAALDAMRWMEDAMEDPLLREDIHRRIEKAANALSEKWWNPQEQYFAFGLDAAGNRADRLGNWPAVLLSLRVFELRPQLLWPGAAALARPELATDWGTRWLSNRDPLYDPVSYNNGSVWPFMNGFVAWAQFANGHRLAGHATWSSVARLTGFLQPGAIPELMNGDFLRAGERAVPHQGFSSFGVLMPAVRGLIGLGSMPDGKTLFFHPNIPPNWPKLRFSAYQLHGTQISGEIRQSVGRIEITLRVEGAEPLTVSVTPMLPYGFRALRVTLNGKPIHFFSMQIGRQMQGKNEIVYEIEGGVGIVPPVVTHSPGKRTEALKILQVDSDERQRNTMEISLAGLGGKMYALDLLTTEKALTADGATVKKIEGGHRLEISFEGPEGDYVTRKVRLRW
jgi:glycogen debranching enzyme